MKKFVLVLCFMLALAVNTYAKTYEITADKIPQFAVIANYTNGILGNVDIIKASDTKLQFESDSEEFSVYLMGDTGIQKAQYREVTEDEQAPEQDSVQENEETEIKKEYPDVYAKEKDAIRAMMIVNSVDYISRDNEMFYLADMYFHGENKQVEIADDVEIISAPYIYSHLIGENAGCLRHGDVIAFDMSFSGKILGVSVLFRPAEKDPMTSGQDYGSAFSELYTAENGLVGGASGYRVMTSKTGVYSSGYGYTFGAVIDRSGNIMTLCDADMGILEIDIADGVVVYECDVSQKFEVTKGSIASVRKTYLTKTSFDEDDNLIELPDDTEYKYAFVRTVDGEATEILMITNYRN